MISQHHIPDLRRPMSHTDNNLLARVLVTTILALGLLAQYATATEKDRKEKDLKILQTKITQLKQAIDVKEDSKSRYTRQLKKIEMVVGGFGVKLLKFFVACLNSLMKTATSKATKPPTNKVWFAENSVI